MKYQQNVRIYFDDGDPGGIVFFGNYFRIVHRVLEDFARSLDLTWEDWFQSSQHAVPLRKVQAEYLKPLYPGKSYKVEVDVLKIGNTSVTFGFQIFNESGEICSRLETTHVFINIKKLEKISIPDAFRRALGG